jgi:hypothetical protein
MDQVIDHERCSELLRDYVTGDLGDADARAVDEHLVTCDRCSAELWALEALTVPMEDLSEIESRRLHDAVAAATREGLGSEEAVRYDSGGTVIPTRSGDWRARIAPFMGAAALIALLIFGASRVMTGGSSADSTNVAGGGAERSLSEKQSDQVEASKAASPNPDGGRPKSLKGTVSSGAASSADTSSDDAAFSTPTSSTPAGAKPTFTPPLGKVTRSEVEDLASDVPFTSFSDDYRTHDADLLRNVYLKRLADQAPNLSLKSEIKDCGSRIFEEGDGYHFLPAFGAVATIQGTRALILGFAYTLQEKAPLNRFQLWAWKRPGCTNVVLAQRGTIGR